MNCPQITIGNGATANGSWPLITTRDAAFTLDRYYGDPFRLVTGEQILATYINGRLVVHSGYASDGYSPVISAPWMPFNDPWLRLTPTPKCGYGPAIIHDITRQFLNVPFCPWDREQTDDWFFNCLTSGEVSKRRAGVYHYAVSGIAGDVYIKATRKVDPNLRIELL